jgi:putative tricarboxylic transport membrane protein
MNDSGRPPTTWSKAPALRRPAPRAVAMHRLGALIPLALGLVWIVYALTSFPLGQLNRPGPAMWPTVVGTGLVVTSVVLFFKERDNSDYEPFTRQSGRVALGAGSVAVFIILYGLVGFIVASFLLLTFWCRYLGRESWRLSLTVAGAVTLVFYVLFGQLLGVPLPVGLVA